MICAATPPVARNLRAWALGAAASLALGCPGPLPEVGHQLFSSPQTNPVALTPDGETLVVANTTSGTVSVFDTKFLTQSNPKPAKALLAEIPVGLDPVGVAIRPGSNHAWVTNHISDTISVVDLDALDVVDTIQQLGNGMTYTDAPTGIVFGGPTRAFVSLDDENEVLVIDTQPDGSDPQITSRLAIRAQAPRAMAVANGKLFVAAFESENQTEFPTCDPADPRLALNGGAGIDESDPHDEGCEFATEIIEAINVELVPEFDFDLDLGFIFDFAAVNPNVKGRIIFDRDRLDRDLFVYDATAPVPNLLEIVEHIGTLLYGVETVGDRVLVTNTDARNHLEGLAALDNRMFDNRLSWVDCNGACGAPVHADLEANAFGVPVPTPYGIDASADGSTLAISVAGSDGIPGIEADPAVDIPGLVTTDTSGNVLGHVQTGAIPQGLVLASHADGSPGYAYVLNTVDSSLSVVDLSDPTDPDVHVTFEVGSDPTPPDVQLGRIQFMSARASTRGTFSCESCHPNSNIDQILWVINTVEGPNDVPLCDPDNENCPEPRTTMPTRGLRDTLPLHWVGNLGDFAPDLPGQRPQPEAPGPPDCDFFVDGEVACMRDLVNGSLSGVMCDQFPFCGAGPSGLPGALDETERDALAAFLAAVSYPPSPDRRADDTLTAMANDGVTDFFTDEDGLGVGSPTGGGIGGAVGFAPVTCADNEGGCHSLSLTNDHNSRTVGGFDAPTMRGIWDRTILFSNGNVSSEEWMRFAQACADGDPTAIDRPHSRTFIEQIPVQILFGDPCFLDLDVPGGGGIPGLPGGFLLHPFDDPSFEDIYRPNDPNSGVDFMTERGQFMGSFEAIFHLAYGVRGANMWQFFREMSIGLAGLVGRQLSLTPATVGDPDLVALMDLVEEYAGEGRITAVARNGALGEYRFTGGVWVRTGPQGLGQVVGVVGGPPSPLTGAGLRDLVTASGEVVTLTAYPPENISIGGVDRQVLLDIDPELRKMEMDGDVLPLPIPEPDAGVAGETIRLGVAYLDPDAQVIVDGELCGACTWVAAPAPVFDTNATIRDYVDVTLALPLTPGMHVVQMLNPNGWMSNEMPVIAR